MNVLILSCSTGEGHNSAARAVAEQLREEGHTYEWVDPSLLGIQKKKALSAQVYNMMIRKKPELFGAVYKAGIWYDSTKLFSPIYLINSVHAKTLWRLIESKGVDAVISSHLFGMEVLTAIRSRLGKYVPSYGILTDYTNVPFFCDSKTLDGYFIPHEDIREQLIEKNIPSDRIYATGIPVAPKFLSEVTKAEAREHLGISNDKKLFLIMCGGIGGGDVVGLCSEMIRRTDPNSLICVLCGRNEKLLEAMHNEFGGNGKLLAVPFTTEANIYMRAADVLLSKPGGLSSTEAAVTGVPLVHIGAIPGCESANIRFFSEHGLSVPTTDAIGAVRAAVALEADHERREAMVNAQKRTINRFAARDIVSIMRTGSSEQPK